MSQNSKQKGVLETAITNDVATLFSTDGDSLSFVERTINLAISTILYVRELLPKCEFEDEVFDGMLLKVLRKGSDNANSQTIELWMSGVVDAFRKQFLKSMCLEISDSQNCLILESYTINFYYGTGNNRSLNDSVLNGTRSTTNSGSVSVEKNGTRSETLRLLQTCLALAKSCSELPKIVSAVLKLSYEENTPFDYQPYGQKYDVQKKSQFLIKPKNIPLGIVNTSHHHLNFITKTCFSNGSTFPETEEKTGKHEGSDKPGAMTHAISDVKKRETHGPSERDNQLSQLPAGSQGKVEGSLVGSSQFTDNGSLLDSVRCPCLSLIKTSLMYQCSGCNNWVHAECFGIDVLSSHIQIDTFYCQLCHKLSKNVCQDRKMVELDVAHEQQKLAVRRRLLGFCNRTKQPEVSFEKFEKILGLECQKELIETLLKEMVKLRVINQLSDDTYTVDKKVAADKMADYFYLASPPVSEVNHDMRKKTIVEQITPPLCTLRKRKTKNQLGQHADYVKKLRTRLQTK